MVSLLASSFCRSLSASGKPLTPQHLQGFWEYSQFFLMDKYGDGPGEAAPYLNCSAYERWWKTFVRNQLQVPVEANTCHDFSKVGSPYAM
jgi:hypothetical protein